jgi:polyhydroxyalkanoate synthesis regulator phasin
MTDSKKKVTAAQAIENLQKLLDEAVKRGLLNDAKSVVAMQESIDVLNAVGNDAMIE